jgi:hypothetical protein
VTRQPTTNNLQPTTFNQQPSTNNLQPTTTPTPHGTPTATRNNQERRAQPTADNETRKCIGRVRDRRSAANVTPDEDLRRRSLELTNRQIFPPLMRRSAPLSPAGCRVWPPNCTGPSPQELRAGQTQERCMRTILSVLTGVACTIAVAGSAAAASITVNALTGTTRVVSDVLDHEVTGSEMDGLKVTATIFDGNATTVLSGTWGFLGGTDHGVRFGDPNFQVDVTSSDDTFDNNVWHLSFNFDASTNYRLMSLLFEGLPGATVFDQRFGGADGTPGSSEGKDFAAFPADLILLPDYITIAATYFDVVAVGANAPVGDLFANVLLEFGYQDGSCTRRIGPFCVAWSYTAIAGVPEFDGSFFGNFTLDTDNVAVPEPASLLLLGAGLLVVARRARRRFEPPVNR